MLKIDAHIHFKGDHPESIAFLEAHDLKLLNVSVAKDVHGEWRRRLADDYSELAAAHPDRYAWCTAFDLPRPDDPDYVERMIEELDRDFAHGALACKVWKNIGMEVKAPDGRFLMVDDPLLEPIFAHLAREGRTLLMHIAEPLACWQPLDPASPHYGYYSKNPEWHMHGKKGFPSHAELIAARDRVAERHPELRVVGAHLGSLAHDVSEVAKRLERYPNFAVDTSARLGDLALQPPEKVRAFFKRFADRVLFGTDLVMHAPQAAMTDAERAQALRRTAECYRREFAYYETRDSLTLFGREVEGLGLPQALLEKLYLENARRWYPGL